MFTVLEDDEAFEITFRRPGNNQVVLLRAASVRQSPLE